VQVATTPNISADLMTRTFDLLGVWDCESMHKRESEQDVD